MFDLNETQREIDELKRKSARADFEIELLCAAKDNGDLDVIEFVLGFIEKKGAKNG